MSRGYRRAGYRKLVRRDRRRGLPKVLALVGVLIAVVLATVAVSADLAETGRPEASVPSTVDPCAVLHAPEVKRLANFPPEASVKAVPVHAVTHIGVPGMAECRWSAEKATGLLVVGMAVGLDREAFAKWKRAADETGHVRPVEGLGREAAWAGNLVVREDGIVIGVKVQVKGDTRATTFERSKIIASRIMERLRSNRLSPE